MRQPEVDKNCQLNDRHQNDWQRNALFDQRDNDKDSDNRDGVDGRKVHRGDVDQVVGAGCLSDQQTVGVVFFDDLIERLDLTAHLAGRGAVFGAEQHQLPAVAFENARNRFGDHLLGNGGTDEAFETDAELDAVGLLKFLLHTPHVAGRQLGVDQHHVGAAHGKLLFQLAVGNHVGHILRQTARQVVVDLVVGLAVAVVGRRRQRGKEYQKDGKNFDHARRELFCRRNQRPVHGLGERLVEHQDHGRQHGHAAEHTQQHALCHDDAEVASERKGHKAERDKACHGGDGAADDRGKGLLDGKRHRLLVVGAVLLVFAVAVPQKDGIVHGDSQLQHRRKRLGDVRDLAQKEVGAEIEQNRNADPGEKHKRDQPVVQKQQHCRDGKHHRDGDIHRFLALTQIAQVGHHGGNARNQTVFSGYRADFSDSVHGFVRGAGGVKEHRHQRVAVGVKGVIDVVRQQLRRNGTARDVTVGEHVGNVVNLLDLVGDSADLPVVHILKNQK